MFASVSERSNYQKQWKYLGNELNYFQIKKVFDSKNGLGIEWKCDPNSGVWEGDNLGCSKREVIVILKKFPVTASHSRDSGGVRGARMICHFSLLNPLIILSSHLIETDVSFSEVTIWRQHTIICLMVYFWVIYHLDQNHPDSIQLGSCEKFQPFWDCFNELFIKPITSDQESQTSPICRVLSADHIRASDRVRAGQGF